MPIKPTNIKRQWVPERTPFGRRKDNSSFYNSWAWRKKRKAFMSKEENQLCIKCKEEGKTTAATFCDHIQRIEDGGDKFNEDNLQPLCTYHHNSKSGKEAHGYKEKPQ